MQTQYLVATDLDGTLLDHYTYSYAAALPAIQRLHQLNIPLIINTSKTFAEVRALREAINNHHPFIVENGSGMVIPDRYFSANPAGFTYKEGYWFSTFGPDCQEITRILTDLQRQFQFEFFGGLSNREVSQLTGLSEDDAAQAKQRDFSEPVLWRDSNENKQAFINALAESGLYTLQGGRFLHVMGDTDKGRSLLQLRDLYEKHSEHNYSVIALGDSGNDVAMLNCANIAVVVRSPNHAPPAVSSAQRVIVSDALGPEGWTQVMNQLLDELTNH